MTGGGGPFELRDRTQIHSFAPVDRPFRMSSRLRAVEQVMGRTRTNRQVFFDGDIEELKGKLVDVRITEARPYSLTGVQEGKSPPR